MAALTAERKALRLGFALETAVTFSVAANTKIYKGASVAKNAAGYAIPADTSAATHLPAGIALATVDNTGGAAGALSVTTEFGIYKLDNSAAGDAITALDNMADCYMIDDHTVAKTSGAGARSAAGKVYGVDTDGVWVKILP